MRGRHRVKTPVIRPDAWLVRLVIWCREDVYKRQDTAQRDYFVLRERIETITNQLNGLQEYVLSLIHISELCWWLIRNDLADALPESAARKALRLPKPVVPSVTRESDLVPSVPALSLIHI